MSLFDPVDNYCERLGPGMWAEPVNTISNIAFFIAAWALWRLYRRGGKNGAAATLIFLVTLVGLGSTLFHFFGNKLTMLGDVIPIAVFTYYYLWVLLRRQLELNRPKAAANLVIFTLMVILTTSIPPGWRLNGSVFYLPCLLAMYSIGTHLRVRNNPAAPYVLKAALYFAISLTYRSIDLALCEAFPLGTHFLWHALNGVVLYLLVRGVLRAN